MRGRGRGSEEGGEGGGRNMSVDDRVDKCR